nr:MAG TPA: hypothetical protein [Caudoviricetes sp.]
MIDVATLTALSKLLFDGLAILIVFILYIKGNQKRDKEYEAERKEQKKRNEELQENYNSMIQDIIKGVSKKHLTPVESKNISKIEKEINDIINQILLETGASRVCIVKYHNGNKDMTGKSFLKMSMTNEVVNLGVAPMMSDFRDLFRSLLAYWCHEIETKECCIISDAEDLKNIDITMYQYLTVRNIEAKYGMGLKDNDGNIIGFICIEYLNKSDFDLKKINNVMIKNFPRIETLVSLDGGVEYEL